MQIGVPKEIKNHEDRVGLIPTVVRELTQRGHRVWVEHNAGAGAGFSDEIYRAAGATITSSAEEVFAKAEMIVKVKEPYPEECLQLREGQILCAFLHLAADPRQAALLLNSGCSAIAYETVTDESGGLPLLTPMSEIGGRLSIQAGARCLETALGGRGVLLGGVPGVAPAKVVILGAGVAGSHAIRMALGLGADVMAFDKSLKRLRELEMAYGSVLKTCYASADKIEEHLVTADLVVGAVLVPGGAAPKLVTREMLRQMRPGSVLADISIDQGGCFETSRPTTHSHPTYIEEGIVHYCVANMPGAVPHTSAIALNNATFPFVLTLAEKGPQAACLENIHLLRGLNVCAVKLTYPAVAHSLHQPFTPPEQALKSLPP